MLRLRQWPQEVLHCVIADLPAHACANLGRETVMDTRPDSGVRWLDDVVLQPSPAMRHAWGGGRRQAEIRKRSGPEERLHYRSRRGGNDAVRTRILGMHWSGTERFPGGIALSFGIVVLVPVANGCDRPPEFIFVLGVKDGDHRVGGSHRQQGEQPGVFRYA